MRYCSAIATSCRLWQFVSPPGPALTQTLALSNWLMNVGSPSPRPHSQLSQSSSASVIRAEETFKHSSPLNLSRDSTATLLQQPYLLATRTRSMSPQERRKEFPSEGLKKFRLFFKLAEADDAVMEPEDRHDLYDQYFPTTVEARAYNDWLVIEEEERLARLTSEERDNHDKRDITTRAALGATFDPQKLVLPEPYDIDALKLSLSAMTFRNITNKGEKEAEMVTG